MSENLTPTSSSNNEIDIIDLLARVTSAIRSLFRKILIIVKYLLDILYWSIRFIYKKRIWYFISIFLTFTFIFILSKLGTISVNMQGTIINTRVLDAQEIRPYFLAFDQYLKAEKYDYLAEVTGVPKNQLQMIKEIKPHFFMNLDRSGVYNYVDVYDDWNVLIKNNITQVEKNNAWWSVDKIEDQDQDQDQDSLENKDKRRVSLNMHALFVEMRLKQNTDMPPTFSLSQMLINFLNSQKEYKQALEVRFKFNDQLVSRIDEEIEFADTLRNSELRRREQSVTNKTQEYGKATIVIDQKGSDGSTDLSLLTSNNSLNLFKQRQALMQSTYYKIDPVVASLSLTQESISVVDGYTYDASPPFIKAAIIWSFRTLIICHFICLLVFFRKRIHQALIKDL